MVARVLDVYGNKAWRVTIFNYFEFDLRQHKEVKSSEVKRNAMKSKKHVKTV